MSAFRKRFPMDDGTLRIEADNWRFDDKRFSPGIARTKNARLAGSSLMAPVRADLRLVDSATGALLEERKDYMVASVPALTHRGTFVLDGTEYMTFSQLRPLPGVYARVKDNGQASARVRTASRTGPGMDVTLDPDSGVFKVELGRGSVRLYDLLHAMGTTDDEIAAGWGAPLLAANRKGFKSAASINRTMAPYVNKWVKAIRERDGADDSRDDDDDGPEQSPGIKSAADLVAPIPLPPERQTPHDNLSAPIDKEALDAFFGKMRFNRLVMKRNLGRGYPSSGKDVLLATSAKVLKVARGEEPGDDLNALYNKTVHTVDDFFGERIENDAGGLGRSLLWAARRKGLSGLNPGWFTPQLTGAIVRNSTSRGTPVSQPIPALNPVDLLDMRNRVVLTGEGGIPSADAIPMDARDVHHTQVGVIDIIRTPESQGAGV